MKNKIVIEVVLSLIFWLLSLLLFVNNSFLRYHSMNVTDEYFSLILVFFVVYINYFILFPRWFNKSLVLYFSLLLISIIFFSVSEFFLIKDDVYFLTSNAGKKFQTNTLYWNFFGIFFRDALFVAFFTMFKIYRDAIKSYKLLQEKTDIEREQYITRIEMVKSKVNTHFFFNTLNSIYALALSKSEKTPDVVIHLSDLMEYVVAESENEKVDLVKEINFIRNYIALESVKYKNINLSFEVKGDVSLHKIPPMIFETFVNNAFKYTNIIKNGFIRINIDCKPELIIFSCENEINKEPGKNIKSTSKGLINAKNRLNLHYRNKHQLEINDDSQIYRVKLSLFQ